MNPLAGFALGLAGSLHCVGMCGPIILAVQDRTRMHARLDRKALSDKLQYQAGRIATYSVLGLLAGYTASAFNLAGIGRTVTIVAGVLMIVFALAELLWQRGILPQSWTSRWSALVSGFYTRSMRTDRAVAPRHLILGVLNGVLPCGLVTSALMGAISMGTPAAGALFMAFFGLGTLPLLLAVSIAGVSLSCKVRAKLKVALPGFALLLGTLILLRGMALGVPYISPEAPSLHPSTSSHTCCQQAAGHCK